MAEQESILTISEERAGGVKLQVSVVLEEGVVVSIPIDGRELKIFKLPPELAGQVLVYEGGSDD